MDTNEPLFTLILPEGTKTLRIGDIPQLTAGAIWPEQKKDENFVTLKSILKMKSGAREHPVDLTEEDSAWFNLKELDLPACYPKQEWEKLNNLIHSVQHNEWHLVPVLDDSANLVHGIRYATTFDDHEMTLDIALDRGIIPALDPITYRPAILFGAVRENLLVRVDDFANFAREHLNINVVISSNNATEKPPSEKSRNADQGDRTKDFDSLPSKLKVLINAYATKWGNADPEEKDTHRKQVDVVAWLVKQGFSENEAKVGATIIRPDWAFKGRPPKNL